MRVDLDWLRQTRLVDRGGAPLRLYHGTRSLTEFDRFTPSRSGAQGPGIYMTDAPGGYGVRTLELYVRCVNPFWFQPSLDSLDAEVNGELLEQVLPGQLARQVIARIEREGVDGYGMELQRELRRRGHDGIVMVYPFGEPMLKGASGSAVVIAFDPDQVVWAREVDALLRRERWRGDAERALCVANAAVATRERVLGGSCMDEPEVDERPRRRDWNVRYG